MCHRKSGGWASAKNEKGKVRKMKVKELREILEGYESDGKGDLEVKIAEQENWPLAAPVKAVSRIGDTVWIADGSANKYAPKAAWDGEDIDEEEDGEDE